MKTQQIAATWGGIKVETDFDRSWRNGTVLKPPAVQENVQWQNFVNTVTDYRAV
jgi:hypothetical protein